jgi:hypothetical protein
MACGSWLIPGMEEGFEYSSLPDSLYYTAVRAVELALSVRHVLPELSLKHFIILQSQHSTSLLQILPKLSFELLQLLINPTQVIIVVRYRHCHFVWVDQLPTPIKVPLQPLPLVSNLTIRVVQRPIPMALPLLVSLPNISRTISVKCYPVLYT